MNLTELRAMLDKLTGQARDKRAELKSDTPAADAARIETEHAAIVAQMEETRSKITEAERAPPPVSGITAEDAARMVREAAAAERERVEQITTLGRRFGQHSLASEHVRTGTSLADFRSALMDTIAAVGEEIRIVPHVQVGVSDSEKRGRAMELALLHRCDPTGNPLDGDVGAQAREFRGMSLLEMGRDFLEGRGVRTRGMSKQELARVVLTREHGPLETRQGLMSTSDFPNILANVVNKTLRQAYSAAPQTFRPITRTTTMPDFKPVNRLQLSEAPGLEKVNEHGEFRRGSMSEAKETYSLLTYGKVIGITRQTLINDDLNAFARIPAAFGQSAANLESDLVWSLILANGAMGDGIDLFHASHANLGSSAAISVTSVGAGRTAMALQTGLDGVTVLNLDPDFIVVPKALQTVAEQFISTTLVPNATADVVPLSMRRLQVISEPRLDNGATNPATGTHYSGSSTNWYMAAGFNQVDVIEIGYLEGEQGVYTETRMGFDVDGMEVKVRLDVGAKVIDYRGLWKNPH